MHSRRIYIQETCWNLNYKSFILNRWIKIYIFLFVDMPRYRCDKLCRDQMFRHDCSVFPILKNQSKHLLNDNFVDYINWRSRPIEIRILSLDRGNRSKVLKFHIFNATETNFLEGVMQGYCEMIQHSHKYWSIT